MQIKEAFFSCITVTLTPELNKLLWLLPCFPVDLKPFFLLKALQKGKRTCSLTGLPEQSAGEKVLNSVNSGLI